MTELPLVGWREWITFPDTDLPPIKAKVDTGARTSALHAWDVAHHTVDDLDVVTFDVHPRQRDDDTVVSVTAELVELRDVTSSSGHAERRPVVRMGVTLGGATHLVEVTLTNRDSMGFRMLLGRTALAGRFLVDPSRSYLASTRPPRDTDHT